MRVIVARCSVEYAGRLGARLPPAVRLVVLKADGSIAIHADAKAYKPLNWMSPPCTITDADGVISARNRAGEELRVELHDVVFDSSFDAWFRRIQSGQVGAAMMNVVSGDDVRRRQLSQWQ